MPTANVFTAEFEYDDDDPDGYRAGAALIGQVAGGKQNVVKAFQVPPGQSICPYHYEYVEEWLLVLEGELTLREPAGDRTLRRGDLTCFPSGPDGAHKVTNLSDSAALALMWSSSHEPSVAVYPDSDKIGVWPGTDGDRVMLRRADGAVDYYDGET
jgi:uncharacterized cupin superfamily protein